MAGTHGQGGGGSVAEARRPGRYPLAVDPRHWPVEAREEFEEREAILLYDAHMAPDRARRAAMQIVRERWTR